MIKSTLCAISLAAALAAGTSSAQAASVSYTFNAVVDSLWSANADGIGDGLSATVGNHHIALGDKLVGTLTYDANDAALLTDNDPDHPGTNLLYNLPTFSLQYAFISGTHALNITGGAGTTWDTPEGDSLNFEAVPQIFESGNTYWSYTNFSIGGPGGDLLNSGAFPAAINLAALDLTWSRLNSSFNELDNSAGMGFTAALTSFQPAAISAVPEADIHLMLLAGLGAIGYSARRRSKASQA